MRTCYPAESQQQLLPPGSGGMRGVGGDAGFGYRSFGGMGRRTMAGGRSGAGAGGKGGHRERGDV